LYRPPEVPRSEPGSSSEEPGSTASRAPDDRRAGVPARGNRARPAASGGPVGAWVHRPTRSGTPHRGPSARSDARRRTVRASAAAGARARSPWPRPASPCHCPRRDAAAGCG